MSLNESKKHFRIAAKLSKLHSDKVKDNIKQYGDVENTATSGVYNSSWPEPEKRILRAILVKLNNRRDKGFAARPKGVHRSTMIKLYQLIRVQKNAGFYS